MFDTHCHLQFKALRKKVDEIVVQAREAGVTHIMVPSTNVGSSRRAVEIARRFENVYAAVGIHPHHVFGYQTQMSKVKSQNYNSKLKSEIEEIEELLKNEKVVAVGEVGLDRHYYKQTKYTDYQINEEFIGLQKEVMKKQIELAKKYDKSLILHNREAMEDFLEVVSASWDKKLEGRTVFHCCEPHETLLNFAKEHNIFIGVDGDVTYYPEKQEFIKRVPLDMLVLETDSPFLTPEPLRSQKKFPNVPANLKIVAEFVAQLHSVPIIRIIGTTTENANKLFNLE